MYKKDSKNLIPERYEQAHEFYNINKNYRRNRKKIIEYKIEQFALFQIKYYSYNSANKFKYAINLIS